MDFSSALIALKNGFRVARAGWNGKGMWLTLVDQNNYSVRQSWDDKTSPEALTPLPWIGMKTADNGFVPWLCSQTDMLADDWEHVT